MKRVLLLFLCLVTMVAARAQTVDTTVCEVLKNPASFDGKIIRLKGTVISGFDEFVIKDSTCGQAVNGIWLSYPEGTKAKSGPVAMVQLRLDKNSAEVTAPNRVAVTLDKNKDFKQFDSLLATPHKSLTCLGCMKYTVTATLTGRIDGSKTAGATREGTGKFTAVNGFGNMSLYPARLVLQSVADVSSAEIDYSKSPVAKDDSGPENIGDPVEAARNTAHAFGSGTPAADQLERAASAFGKPGEHNGVVVGFGVSNEAKARDEGKGNAESPDGLLFTCTFDTERLRGDALSKAITHVGTHIADLREHGVTNAGEFEAHAWETVIFSIIATRQKTLTLPGGFIVWNSSWSPDDRNKLVNDGLGTFINSWEPFGQLKTTPSSSGS
jgi:hypothetical protein